MSSQIIPLKSRTHFWDPAQFWPQRPFAFELRCRGHAARAWFCRIVDRPRRYPKLASSNTGSKIGDIAVLFTRCSCCHHASSRASVAHSRYDREFLAQVPIPKRSEDPARNIPHQIDGAV
jgi:hypothetical protein